MPKWSVTVLFSDGRTRTIIVEAEDDILALDAADAVFSRSGDDDYAIDEVKEAGCISRI